MNINNIHSGIRSSALQVAGRVALLELDAPIKGPESDGPVRALGNLSYCVGR